MAAATFRRGGCLREARGSADLARARGLRCRCHMYNTIATHVHIGGFPNAADPRATAWLDDAMQIATAFMREVSDDVVRAAELFVVHLLALSVWQTTSGKPRWDDLDVEHALDLANRYLARADDNAAFVAGFMAFICYLNEHQLITKKNAARIRDALQPTFEPILLRHLQSLPELSATWPCPPSNKALPN